MKRLTVGKEEYGCIRVREVKEIIVRLAEIEDIISDENSEYDLDRIKVIFEQKISLRKEAAERFKITKNIPIERLREIVKEYKDGRSD